MATTAADLYVHDAVHIIAFVLGLGITTAVTRNDVKWIKEWCRTHKADDETHFQTLEDDIRELRRTVHEDTQ